MRSIVAILVMFVVLTCTPTGHSKGKELQDTGIPSALSKFTQNSFKTFRIHKLQFDENFQTRLAKDVFPETGAFAFDARVTSFVKDYVCLSKLVAAEKIKFNPANFQTFNYVQFELKWNAEIILPSMEFELPLLIVKPELLDNYLPLLAKFCGESPCPNTCCSDCSPKPCK